MAAGLKDICPQNTAYNTVTAMPMSTTAVARKKIHAAYFWSVGGSYTNNRNQIN
jgi:hypothetical protein